VQESTGEAAEVVVIGSGFGGSVATLRFAEAGKQVVVLERGGRVSRDKFQVDLDFLWRPSRNAYGFHDIRTRGKQIIPWIGAAVGGGSHVYAGTLKRRDAFDDFPAPLRADDMTAFYGRAEAMLGANPLPDYPPYGGIRATALMVEVGERLEQDDPHHDVEHSGKVPLGISFAPAGGTPGAEFVNAHGCTQRYYDPTEQSILGGDIDTKNSLDRNYLHVAEHAAARPAEIRPMCEADRIERLPDGRYRVHYVQHAPATGWAAFRQRYLFGKAAPRPAKTITARHLVIACGAIGSTELLLRNQHVHKTLDLGRHLGTRYSTNGDYLTLIVKFRGLFLSWLGFSAMVVCALLGAWIGVGAGALAYYGGLAISGRASEPDIGTTNSDCVQFKGHTGQPQGAFIESGRYPTPGGLLAAVVWTGLRGRFRPRRYRALLAAARALRWIVPPFGALARTYPIPLLSMGKVDAFGTVTLDARGAATIEFEVDKNRAFYAHLAQLGKRVARAADAYWLPDLIHKVLGRLEVPHNLGGVPMGDDETSGVVDHAGRVFGFPGLVVLDGSIIPVAVGPNPALTITAVAERAMQIIVAQVEREGTISASIPLPVTDVA
jgi:cholesterol oxidase